MRRSSRSSPSRAAALAAVMLAAGCIVSAQSGFAKTSDFKVATRDGKIYTSATEPAIKKGYLFLTDGDLNFFSLPLETIDWSATQAANHGETGKLLERWEEGPVRYLLRAEEVREYRTLPDNSHRATWISSFWASLDPTPHTFFNERRFAYWSRLEAANRLFADSTRPGWMTDRGKIYLLVGPPDEIESFPSRSGNDARFDARYTEDAPAGYPRHTIPPRGVVRWTYRNPPGNLGPNTLVAFREDPSGEYKLSNEAIDYDRAFRDMSAGILSLGDDAHPRLGRSGGSGATRAESKASMDRLGAPPSSELSLLGDLGRLQDLALAQDWLREVVSAREYFGTFPLHSAFHFYRSREDQTYIEVNLELETPPPASSGEPARPSGGRAGPGGRPPAPPFSLSARLVSQADPSRVVEFGADDGFAALPDPGAGERWLYQSGVGVEPGSYTLLVAITETATGRIGSWRELIDVPDLRGGGLMLSDLVLASKVEAIPSRAGSGAKEPFIHGRLRVVPDVDRSYGAGSDLSFYYQIYGASADPISGRPELDLLYRLERRENDSWRAFGTPVHLEMERDSSQAFAMSLIGWPAGSYRLMVEVADSRTGQRTSRAAEFIVRTP